MLLESNKVVPSCVSLCARERERGRQASIEPPRWPCGTRFVSTWIFLAVSLKKNYPMQGFVDCSQSLFHFVPHEKSQSSWLDQGFGTQSQLTIYIDGLCNHHVLSVSYQQRDRTLRLSTGQCWRRGGGQLYCFLFKQQTGSPLPI